MLNNGPTPATFCLFSFFSKTNFTEKNCDRQRDSNSDLWSKRQAHGPLDHHHDPIKMFSWVNVKP